MPELVYSERFADDLAAITSARLEARILADLDNIERFGEFGSKVVPQSIRAAFGDGVRKVAVNPFDLVYTFDAENDRAYIEALVPQRAAR